MYIPCFKAFLGGFTNIETYRRAITYPMRASLWYVAQFYIVIALFLGVATSVYAYQISRSIQAQIPENAVITFDKGALTTQNLEIPWTVSLPLSFQLRIQKEHIEMMRGESHLNSLSYAELIPIEESITVSSQEIRQYAAQTFPVAAAISVALMVLIIVVGRIFAAAIHTLLVSWILSLLGMQLPLGKLFQLSLHISITAEVIATVSLLLYHSSEFPMYEATFIGIMLLALRSLRRPSA